MITLQLQRLPDNPDLPLPSYSTQEAAAFDLRAAVPADQPLTLAPGQRALIGTGFRANIPIGYEMQIRPRSGLALKNGISLVNSPGTIDADYRHPIGVIVINHGQEAFTINRGDRIAQALITPAPQVQLVEVESLPELTITGPARTGGFGTTGTA